MKYVVLLGDGMAGRPLAELGGRTTLEAAGTPNMDRLASCSLAGRVQTVPEGFPYFHETTIRECIIPFTASHINMLTFYTGLPVG